MQNYCQSFYAYYEIGRMIVEEEQHGENRAAYGTRLLKELSVLFNEELRERLFSRQSEEYPAVLQGLF